MIQNVSFEMPTFWAAVFDYGDVLVQTAGSGEFTFVQVPGPREVQAEIFRRMEAYRERQRRLEAEGRMTDAGRAEVERAKADGRWDAAYGSQATAEMPEDLLAAIAANPDALAWFDVLTKSNRFALYYRVTQAKRPETRARRIADLVARLARGETPYPQKARPEGR